MRSNELKVAIFLLALLLSFGLLLGGQKLYNSNLLEKPVINDLLKLNYVEKVTITKEAGVYQDAVQIKQAGNIKTEYKEIDSRIKTKIRGKQYKLELLDTRTQTLENELQKMELGIYEAIAKNNYLSLDQRFAVLAAQDHFDYRLQIDEKRLYLQITSGDQFLYQIFPRSEAVDSQPDKGV